ncbi:MAG TPA: cytosolic protein [Candidatus Marinimicrobia bacterium]|nr:cytosolic protein [Candidatus Neomarinimicrobiota bacterium]
MECNQQKNRSICNCSYEPCSRKGICCECIRYHLRNRELPACCFPDDVEKTYDRSFERFAQMVNGGRV